MYSYKTAKQYYNIQEPDIKYTSQFSDYHTPVRMIEEPYANTSVNNSNIKPKPKTNLSDPKVWGSAFWFTLHNGAANYPKNPNPHHIRRMKGFILGMPVMIRCTSCKTHCCDYIEINKHNLDDICSSRDKLFKFFVNFHNIVNKRHNKPQMSYEKAYSMYVDGNMTVEPMKYG